MHCAKRVFCFVFLKISFTEKLVGEWERFRAISTNMYRYVWKLQKFSLTLCSQKFRESNCFTKEITKYLIWRNYFSLREFLVFPHCALHSHTVEFTKFLYHLKLFSWNHLYSKLFTKEIVFTKIFQKVVILKFRT